MAVSLKDIASVAGVTRSTVSKALRGAPDISVERAKEICEVAHRLGYRPNRAARLSVSKRTYTIGVVGANLSNPSMLRCFQGMIESAEQGKYSALIQVSVKDDYMADVFKKAHDLLDHRVDGLVINPVFDSIAQVDQLRQRCPYVVVCSSMGYFSVPTVTHDYVKSGYVGARHLIELGHKKIVYIHAGLQRTEQFDKKSGILKALAEYRIQVNEDTFVRGADSIQGGREVMGQMLREGNHPTAVICHSHLVARGVFNACAEMGIRIPQDLSVIDGDMGHYDAEMNTFRPTRLELFPERMGKLASQMVIDWLEQTNGEAELWTPQSIVIEPQMLLGDSTGAPREGALKIKK